jgi:hypothetical protein
MVHNTLAAFWRDNGRIALDRQGGSVGDSVGIIEYKYRQTQNRL